MQNPRFIFTFALPLLQYSAYAHTLPLQDDYDENSRTNQLHMLHAKPALSLVPRKVVVHRCNEGRRAELSPPCRANDEVGAKISSSVAVATQMYQNQAMFIEPRGTAAMEQFRNNSRFNAKTLQFCLPLLPNYTPPRAAKRTGSVPGKVP